MATRLKGEFRSENGTLYEVQINDDTFVGTADEVKLGGDGFTLTHDGETDDIYSPIVGSSVDVTFYAETSQIESFASNILNAQEKRFTMRILKGEVGSQALFWTGYVVQDLIEEADESLPKAIRLRATDGISLLSTLDYEFDEATSNGLSIKAALLDIFDKAQISSLFESAEVALVTAVQWFAEEHVFSASLDPVDNTKVDLKVFAEYLSSGDKRYDNALDVIRQFALLFSARFYFSDGSFRFEQITQRDTESITEFRYLTSGALDSTASASLFVDVDQSNTYRGSGVFRYLPAVKKTQVSLSRLASQNVLGRSVNFPSSELDLGIIPSVDNSRLLIEVSTRIQTVIASASPASATPIFSLNIRLEPTDGSANLYWKNVISSTTLNFGPGSWDPTPASWQFATNTVALDASSNIKTSISMATGPLPKDGEVFVDLTFVGFYDFGFDPSFISSPNTYTWSATILKARYENDNLSASTVETIASATNTSTTIGSNIIKDLGALKIGDGPGALGTLYVYNGTGYVRSTGWRVRNAGSYIDINELLVREVLGLQSSVVKRFEGIIYRGGAFKSLYGFDTAYWLPMRSTFNANMDEAQVEVFKIAKDTSDITVDVPVDVVDDADALSVASAVGVYANIGSGTAALEQVQLTGGTPDQGVMNWNTDEDTIQMQMNGTTHFIGQDVVYNVKNQTGATIGKGVAVMAVGTLGASGRILIAPADATGETPARFFIGVTAEEIADGADGKVVEFGKVKQIDTSAYTEGDVLWLDPNNDGQFTTIEPGAPNLKIAAALVIYAAANGTIMVRANQGHSIADAHDVRISNLQDQDILKWDAGAKYWYNTPLTLV